MADYFVLADAIVRESKARESALRLLDETCNSRFFLQPERPEKVFLFLHGFTAAPIQFEPIGKTLFEAGYNVVVPLLPGHGLAGNWDKSTPPPLPDEPNVYQQFAQEWLEKVQGLGKEVIVGGLSGGGTAAAWLALEFPQRISRAMLFAPYLSNSNVVVDWIVRIFDGYFEWGTQPGTKPGTRNFGYKGFLMPALEVFLHMGKEVLQKAESSPAVPMLIISSEIDQAVSEKDLQTLFESVLRRHPNSWYHRFASKFGMPHTMMTQTEGNQFVELLISVARAYVESDLTWAEVQTIRDRVAQGQSFDETVAGLGLQKRTTDTLIPLVTM